MGGGEKKRREIEIRTWRLSERDTLVGENLSGQGGLKRKLGKEWKNI